MPILLDAIMVDRVSIIFFGCSLLGGFCHYLFNLAMTRMMDKGELGQMMTLLNLVVMTAVPLTAFQTVVTQSVATWTARGQFAVVQELWRRMGRDLLILGLCLGGGIFLAAGKLQSTYDLPSRLPVYVMATIPLPMVLLPALRGILQGAHAFIPLGLNMVLEGLARVGIGVGLVYAGFGMAGGLAATTGASLLAILFGYVVMRRVWQRESTPAESLDLLTVYKFAIPVFLAQIALSQMAFMDLPVLGARFPMEKEALGLYAGAQLLGKGVFFLPLPFSGVMFSRVAALEVQGLPTRPVVLKTLGIVALICLGVVGVFAVMPEFVLTLTIGKKYFPGASLLAPFGFAMTGFALANTLVYYHLSRKMTAFLPAFFVATLVQWAALAKIPSHPFEGVQVLVVCSMIHLGVQMWYLFRPAAPRLAVSAP